MKFWYKLLKQLEQSDMTFKSYYGLIQSQFQDEIFSQQLINNQVETITYKQIYKYINAVALAIYDKFGVENKGRFISIKMENSPFWVASFFGILMAGYKPFLMNNLLNEDQTILMNQNVNALAMIISNKESDDFNFNVKDLVKNESDYFFNKWEDEFALMTSGTTGEHKIIIYDANAICSQILMSEEIIKKNYTIKHNSKGEVTILAFLPFYHIFGLIATLLWFFFFGRTFVFISIYDSKNIQYASKRFNVTHFFAIPLVWDGIADHIIKQAKKEKRDAKLRKAIKFSNRLQSIFPRFGKWVACNILFKKVRKEILGNDLRFTINGGSHLKSESSELLNGLGYSLYNGYGLTEAGIVCVELSLKPKNRTASSIGKIFNCYEYMIDDDGVLLLKGKCLHKASIKEGAIIKKEYEWFKTRDVFEQNRNGSWRIVGRIDDIIIGNNGENISPELIEKNLRMPDELIFCMIGLENEQKNDELSLIIEFSKEYSNLKQKLIIDEVFKRIDELPLINRPHKVYKVIEPIPKNLGKIQRVPLKNKIKNHEIELIPVSRNQNEELKDIFNEYYEEILVKVKKAFAKTMNVDYGIIEDNINFMDDLGGNSLEYFTLIHELSEVFNIDFDLNKNEFCLTPTEFAKNIFES